MLSSRHTGMKISSLEKYTSKAQGRVVVSVAKDAVAAFEKELDIPYEKLGWITDEKIVIDGEDWGSIIDWKHLYQSSIETILSGSLESEGALSMI